MISLLEFPQSHFCEKARWALDHKDLVWYSKRLIPGMHRLTVKKHAEGTSLPVILDASQCVQGSHEITTYLDEKYPQKMLGPADKKTLNEWIELEREIDEGVGIPLVVMHYHWLFQDPKLMTHYYMNGFPIWQRGLFRAAIPIISQRAKKIFGLTEERYKDSLVTFEKGLSWLEAKISSDGYISGSQFSRLDISAATALVMLVRPPQHPYPWPLELRPKETHEFYDRYKSRSGFKWMLEVYKKHRLSNSGQNT